MTNKQLIKNRGQFLKHVKGKVPKRNEVICFMNEIMEYLFPILAENQDPDHNKNIDEILAFLEKILKSYSNNLQNVSKVVNLFRNSLPDVYEFLIDDAIAITEGDPAASSIEEVIISYPGFYSILVYRIAHELDNLSIPVMPRMLTEFAHSKTGIDIHPRAKIGRSFCIDHGTGIVIGETTEIKNSVKIYQGVTLGALSVSKKNASIKRHPTIEDNVTIYSGSTILGGNTIVGKNSIIGGNVWLTHSVDPNSVVLNKNEIRFRNGNTDTLDNFDFVI